MIKSKTLKTLVGCAASRAQFIFMLGAAICAIWLAVFSTNAVSASAGTMTTEDRRGLLDSIRPEATRKAGQAVLFKIDRLNQDGDWVVIVGAILGVGGKKIDWKQAANCDANLDKLLWVVAKKVNASWQVKHMEVCSPEPPYWDLEQYGGFVWPCGVYAGLVAGDGNDIEQQCRKQNAQKQDAQKGMVRN